MLDLQREHDWHLRESSAEYAETILKYTSDHISRLSRGLVCQHYTVL